MSITNPSSVADLRAALAGEVLESSDSDYDEARQVWNGAIDKHPALIVRCRTVADVVATIRYARETGLELAVRGGGHSLPGFSTSEGGVVLDLSPMQALEVDPEAGVATVQGGALWSQYDAATHAHRLASTGGLISHTGVAGLTLGGGIGWLTRKYGLACDNLLAAELVTASGETVRASADQNSELLWAIRGGGGNFGVVTRFEFRVHPVATILGGMVLVPAERAEEIARFYRDYIRDLPDELTTVMVAMSAPPAPFVPEALHFKPAVAIAACYCGDLTGGEKAVKPLRDLGAAVEMLVPMPYPALQSMLDESAPKGRQNYFKSGYLGELSDDVITIFVEQIASRAHPLSQIHLHHMGGAFSRVGEDDTAFSGRDAIITYNAIGQCETPDQFQACQAWVRATYDRLSHHHMERAYVNFMGDNSADVSAAYGEAKYARLRELKRQYDPSNLFRLNQNIKP